MSEIKPIHVKPAFYAFVYESLKAIAKEYGYNLVLHGSMHRDLDLIAIPWSDEAGDELTMIKHFDREINGIERIEAKQYLFSILPGGRKSYVINVRRGEKFNGVWDDAQYYFDISITPRLSIATNLDPVQAVQDDSCHWYIIPNEMRKHFYNDLENQKLVDSGEFGEKYDDYRTNGDVNNIQLYIKK
jgi:hypothetical protein